MAEDNKAVVIKDDGNGGPNWFIGLAVLAVVVVVLWAAGVFNGGPDNTTDIEIDTPDTTDTSGTGVNP